MAALDMAALKAYVTRPNLTQNQSLSVVSIDVSHSLLKQRVIELKLELSMTVGMIKDKIYKSCGTTPDNQVLHLFDYDGREICVLNDDEKMFGFYSPMNGFRIHVDDLNPHSLAAKGGLEDVSLIEKYKMSDDDYSKREGTYRQYKQKMLEKDPNWKPFPSKSTNNINNNINNNNSDDNGDISDIVVGSRCQLHDGERRGAVKFVGSITGLPSGVWIGVQLDEPMGKNDGSVKGVKIFECLPNYGVFIRPNALDVGDFPERDDLLEDDEV